MTRLGYEVFSPDKVRLWFVSCVYYISLEVFIKEPVHTEVFFIAICYHDSMKMFIILLVFVFALFFLGGSLLFDSGIADAKGIARIPVAVRIEKTYFEVRKQLAVVSPIISEVQKFFSGR